ncbi:MAG: class 1 fructose-bisphosphatase [Polyangiaceae bacterium]|nr:class 1 fructose-bisphosphatase [Polyangiaceae bacterium]
MTTEGPRTDAELVGMTLAAHVLEGMLEAPAATGAFTALLDQIVLAAKLITGRVRRAGLADALGLTGDTNVQGERVQKMDVLANDTLVAALRHRGTCAGLVSEELEEALVFERADAGYLVVADPLDGSSNIDVAVSIGTIFGVLRHDPAAGPVRAESFLRPGRELCAAGYVLYGSSTVLVLTTGQGAHAFTWDPSAGEFFLSHPNLRCPPRGSTYSINEGNTAHFDPGIRRYLDHVKAKDAATGRPYSHRYVGSLVADVHRTLLKGGLFAYPHDAKSANGKLRLLYEANPIAALVEAAGGRAITGRGQRVLDVTPRSIHERAPLVCGSAEDVALYEQLTAG